MIAGRFSGRSAPWRGTWRKTVQRNTGDVASVPSCLAPARLDGGHWLVAANLRQQRCDDDGRRSLARRSHPASSQTRGEFRDATPMPPDRHSVNCSLVATSAGRSASSTTASMREGRGRTHRLVSAVEAKLGVVSRGAQIRQVRNEAANRIIVDAIVAAGGDLELDQRYDPRVRRDRTARGKACPEHAQQLYGKNRMRAIEHLLPTWSLAVDRASRCDESGDRSARRPRGACARRPRQSRNASSRCSLMSRPSWKPPRRKKSSLRTDRLQPQAAAHSTVQSGCLRNASISSA